MLKRGFSFAPGYRLETFLGRGQFGQVWRATAPGGAVAAVKFIDLSGGEGAKEHEGIKRVKQIRHANLMPITAIWLLDGQGKAIEEAPNVAEETITLKPQHDPMATADSLPAMSSPHVSQPGPLEATGMVVMPQEEPAWLAVAMLLGGKSLQQRLRECVKNGLPGIPPKELIAYMDESAKGLDFLNIPQHDLGEGLVAIQHCDVKPANIVLLGSSAVVCDFGLARILSRNQVTATSAAGTPAYMAPEAIAGRPSKTSDQYSLAVTYYHLRTGTLPIADGTLWQVLDAHKTGKLDLSRVSEHEQAVLKRATSLQWEMRFESNGDFVESLREALRVEGHTRPVMMPSSGRVASPASMPTSALDPSMTLMPGQDVTVPAGGVAVEQDAPTLANSNATDTKNDSAVKAAANLADTVAVPKADRPGDSQALWWQQPKWLASGAALMLVPLLLMAALYFRPGGEAGASSVAEDTDPQVVADVVPVDVVPGDGMPKEPVTPTKSLEELLAQAAMLLDSDEVTARKSFKDALALDPSLLEPTPAILSGHAGAVLQAAFSNDGNQLVTMADDPQAFAWPLGDVAAQPIGQSQLSVRPRICEGTNDLLTAFAVDPIGKNLAIADRARSLVLSSFSDVTKPKMVRSISDGEPISLAWHPKTSALLLATDFPSAMMVVETQADQGAEPLRFEVVSSIKSIAMDPLGTWLLVLSDGAVSKVAWSDIQALKQTPGSLPLERLTSEGAPINVMAVTHDAASAEAAVVTGGEQGEITIWPLSADGKTDRKANLHSTLVTAIAVSPEGTGGAIVSGDMNGNIGFWRSGRQQPTITMPAHTATIASLDISADGRWLVAASYDGDVTLWDLSQDELPMTRLHMGNAAPANVARMDSSGRWIAVGHSDSYIALWDLRHAKLLIGEMAEKPQSESVPEKKPKSDARSV